MKRILSTLVILCSLFILHTNGQKVLSIYKDGFVVNRIPLTSIDSMNFNDTEFLFSADEILSAPEKLMQVMVQYNLASTSHDSFGYMAILHAGDMMSEDIVMSKLSHFRYDYTHDNTNFNYRRTNMIWTYFTEIIKISNKVIESTPSTANSDAFKKSLGHAYGMRAFAHFYLMQLYQFTAYYANPANLQLPTIPYQFAGNESLYKKRNYRVSAAEVLTHCESDYKKAAELLTPVGRGTKNELNVNVVNGLLARLYLLKGDWENAITAARAARLGFPLMSQSDLQDGFMNIYNPEWIWGFDHNDETKSLYASFFSHISNLTAGYAGLDYAPRLIDKRLYESIPPTDLRKGWFQDAAGSIVVTQNIDPSATTWKLPYANLKFGWDGNFTMDYVYMRSAEMYLIEAEAQMRAGRTENAREIINQLLASRRPDQPAATITLEDILLQRRIELWGEGFAYFDLKRLNKGIDRTYANSNHNASPISIKAGDKRWNFELPERAYSEFPGMTGTNSMPSLTPVNPAGISGTKASFECQVSNIDPSTTLVVGTEYTTDPQFSKNIQKSSTNALKTKSDNITSYFGDTLQNLNPETKYYLKYYCFLPNTGITYSSIFDFTTKNLKRPDAVTAKLESLTEDQVVLSLNYTFNENSVTPVLRKGFELSKDSSFTSNVITYAISSGNTHTITDLEQATFYYYRGFVTTIDGTVRSTENTLTTLKKKTGLPYAGRYYMNNYTYSNNTLESTFPVDFYETANSTVLRVKNFWGGGEEILINFDEVTKSVSIANDQIIRKHATLGDTKALPYNGTTVSNTPLIGTIADDGTITLNSWSAQTASGSSGYYKSSTLTPVTVKMSGTYTEVDYKTDGSIEATYSNSVQISSVAGELNKLKITNFWDGGNYDIYAIMNFETGTFTIAPQIIYVHSTYGNCMIYPINITTGSVDKTGTATSGIIESDGSLTVGSWAPGVDAGFFGKYLKTTLTKSAPSSAPRYMRQNSQAEKERKIIMINQVSR